MGWHWSRKPALRKDDSSTLLPSSICDIVTGMNAICPHPNLTQIVNIEMGGKASTTYRCEKCDALLTLAIRPFQIVIQDEVPDTAS